jgi:hypothetical protein
MGEKRGCCISRGSPTFRAKRNLLVLLLLGYLAALPVDA